jgi:hypothetical protein
MDNCCMNMYTSCWSFNVIISPVGFAFNIVFSTLDMRVCGFYAVLCCRAVLSLPSCLSKRERAMWHAEADRLALNSQSTVRSWLAGWLDGWVDVWVARQLVGWLRGWWAGSSWMG